MFAGATIDPGLGACHARHAGHDLHAGVCVDAAERDRLERVTRYALRPPPMPFLLDGLATAGGDDQILVDTRS